MLTQGHWWRNRRLALSMVAAGLIGAGFLASGFLWFVGDGDLGIQRGQIQKVDDVAYRVRPFDRSRIMISGRHYQIFEDGQLLGPELDEPWEVRRQGMGSYFQRRMSWGPGRPRGTEIVFSATDNSNPIGNGRRYTLGFSNRSVPASWLVLFAVALSAALFPWMAKVLIETEKDLPASRRVFGFRRFLGASGLALFSVYIFQAPIELVSMAVPWLVAAFLLVAAGTLSFEQWRRPGTWTWWIGGLAIWSAATIGLAPGSYASVSVYLGALATVFGGALMLVGCRGLFVDRGVVKSSMAYWHWVVFATLLILRSAYLDAGEWLQSFAAYGLFQRHTWVFKIGEHWLLVLAWIAVIALSGDPASRRSRLLFVGLGTSAVLVVGMTRTSLVALVLSVAAASLSLFRPGLTRKVIGGAAAVGFVLAPLVGRIPWWIQNLLHNGKISAPLETFETAVRGGIWRHACDLILFHPLVGWGFGASSQLPSQAIPLGDVLAVPDKATANLIEGALAMPGGHPHNLALQTWLDLGFLGAFLMAGLVLAVAHSIAARESNRAVHAGLIGLFTATLAWFAANYNAWNPTLLSLLWIPAVLAQSVLPKIGYPNRRAGPKWWIAIACIIALGVAALGWVRAERWVFVQKLRRQPVVLAFEKDRIEISNRVLSLTTDPRVRASLELITDGGDNRRLLRGWAFDSTIERSKTTVLVFVDSQLPGVAWPDRPTPFLLGSLPDAGVGPAFSGFEIEVPRAMLNNESPTTIVVINSRGAFRVTGPSLSSLQQTRKAD